MSKRQKNMRREARRAKRRLRVRRDVQGTMQKPRLCVYRSLQFTYAQLIADDEGKVLAAASTKGLQAGEASSRSVDCAKVLGGKIAELAKQNNIETVVFDRNGYRYHGRVAAVADGAREGGLQF